MFGNKSVILFVSDSMEKFLVTGLSSSSSKKLQLILPKGKHYKIHGVKNGEDNLKTEALLDKAVNRMATQMKYLHVHPYAGIPLDCPQCTRDVKEHQLLHMVWHVRCRFCRMEMRPLCQKSVVTLSDYKEAEKVLMNVDGRTCAFCLVQQEARGSNA